MRGERKNADPFRPDAVEKDFKNPFRGNFVQRRTRFRDQFADHSPALRFHGFPFRIPVYGKLLRHQFRQILSDVPERQRGGGKDPLAVSFTLH